MQPANAYSSLALVIIGLTILSVGYRKWFGVAMGLSAIFVGVGSFYYHAHLTLGSQLVDNLGMYLIVLIPVALLLHKRFHSPWWWSVGRFVGLVLLSGMLALGYSGARRYELAIFIVGLLVMDFRRGKEFGIQKRTNLAWALGIFLVSFVIWFLDVTKLVCAPESILQGHALWHILNAVAVYFLYRHYEQIA